MKTSMFSLLFLASLLGVAGCDTLTPEPEKKAVVAQGQVDQTLPTDAQSRQRALRKFLGAVLEGVADPGGLSIYAPGVEYRAKYEDFNGASGRLVRWEFNGRPSGNDVPVVLFFADQATGLVDYDNLRRQEKVYAVARAGQRFAITPK